MSPPRVKYQSVCIRCYTTDMKPYNGDVCTNCAAYSCDKCKGCDRHSIWGCWCPGRTVCSHESCSMVGYNVQNHIDDCLICECWPFAPSLPDLCRNCVRTDTVCTDHTGELVVEKTEYTRCEECMHECSSKVCFSEEANGPDWCGPAYDCAYCMRMANRIVLGQAAARATAMHARVKFGYEVSDYEKKIENYISKNKYSTENEIQCRRVPFLLIPN
ncbi:hypothetical protein EXVG_00255 [Emiliania huxleyi virus 202]|nr:hypothetical protein EXVG_00255 [Emiliania huxleyi virus 202]AHA54126.1 hypothetical protein EhV18_00079 [Emiliania huxleyi virus 18]AHA55173.1 hypothetical protein EhV156_00076 [Emiliania huxleyi virus 156]